MPGELRGHPLVALFAVLACIGLSGCDRSRPARQHSRSGAEQIAKAERTFDCNTLPGQECVYLERIGGWVDRGRLSGQHVAGAIAFVSSGCVLCHTYRTIGSEQLEAPDLTHIGRTMRQAQVARAIRCPACLQRRSRMPPFRRLPRQTIDQLAAFLAASR